MSLAFLSLLSVEQIFKAFSNKSSSESEKMPDSGDSGGPDSVLDLLHELVEDSVSSLTRFSLPCTLSDGKSSLI